MKKLLLAATAVIALTGVSARADTILDPLHLFCSNCSGDNGMFNPFPSGGTVNDITVDETGTKTAIKATDFFLKVLFPVDSLSTPTLVTEQFKGTLNGSPFPTTDTAAASTANPAAGESKFLFVSGVAGQSNPTLEVNFLGLTNAKGAPQNHLNTFLGPTQFPGIDPNAVGYLVLTLDLGALTVPEQGKGVSPFDLSSLGNLPAGTWILGDACTSGTLAAGNCTDVTTATSAALFAKPQNVTVTPLPATVWLFGPAMAGIVSLALRRRKRSNAASPWAA
jgi:hypothetical protein